MLSPNVCSVSVLMSFSGLVFLWWHIWHYDRFRCLMPTRRDWFRTLICWLLIAGPTCFLAYGIIQTYVLYDQYYTTISGKTIPKPWQLWPAGHQQLWRQSLYIVTVGWALIQAVHLEEFLYWAYLMSSIRYPTGPKIAWGHSTQFKIWLGATLSGLVLLISSAHIEKTNLDAMRAYIFLIGSGMSIVFAMASTALVIAMPSFINAVRAQGAPYDVLDRLDFFTEMNGIRVLFRWVYAISFMILSADGLSTKKPINLSPFASDFLGMAGQIGVFVTACLSVLLLLPRNMSTECLPPSAQPQKMRMIAYPRRESRSVQHHLDSNGTSIVTPVVGTGALGLYEPRPTHAHQMLVLGQRLNIDWETILDMAEDVPDAQRLKPSGVITKRPSYTSSGGGGGGDGDAESSKNGFRASRSEEHINPRPTPDPTSSGSGSGSIGSKLKKGVRWSEAPSLSIIPVRTPGSPSIGSMSPRSRMRQSEVWVRTETVKHEME